MCVWERWIPHGRNHKQQAANLPFPIAFWTWNCLKWMAIERTHMHAIHMSNFRFHLHLIIQFAGSSPKTLGKLNNVMFICDILCYIFIVLLFDSRKENRNNSNYSRDDALIKIENVHIHLKICKCSKKHGISVRRRDCSKMVRFTNHIQQMKLKKTIKIFLIKMVC